MRFIPMARGCDPFTGMRAGTPSPVPSVRFRSVVRSALFVKIACGGCSLGYRDDVVLVAPTRRHRADRVGACAVAVTDRETQLAGGESAEFGDIEQVSAVVGDQPMEQRARLRCEIPDRVRGDEGGAIHQLARSIREPEQRRCRHDNADVHLHRPDGDALCG